jgi:large-conductance mechanosensitive channel
MKMPLGSLWSEFKAFAFKGNMIDLAVAVVIGGAFSTVITSLVNDVIMPGVTYAVSTASSVATTAGKTLKDTASTATSSVGLTTKPAETQPAETQPASAPAPSAPAAAGTVAEGALPGTMSTEQAVRKGVSEALKEEADIKAKKDAEDAAKKAAEDAANKPVNLEWKIGPVKIGNFIGALINFTLIALAVFLVIVKLLGSVMKRVEGTPAPSEPTTRECPECLSIIPLKAKRCPNCTSVLTVPPPA